MNSFSHSRRLSSLNIDWQIFSDHFSAEFFFCSDFFACHGAKAKPLSVRRKHEKTQIIMNNLAYDLRVHQNLSYKICRNLIAKMLKMG